jgi:hypothetical protein
VCSLCSSFVNTGSKTTTPALYVEFIEMVDDDRNVLKGIVTGDESLYFMYDPKENVRVHVG